MALFRILQVVEYRERPGYQWLSAHVRVWKKCLVAGFRRRDITGRNTRTQPTLYFKPAELYQY